MKVGDLVRLSDKGANLPDYDKTRLGLLLKYEKWEKVADVLFKGKVRRIRAEHVTKAGKLDGLCE